MPGWVRMAALGLIPLLAVAAVVAIGVVSAGRVAPAGWLVVVPLVAPALVGGYAVWSLLLAWRARIPADPMWAVVWTILLVRGGGR